MIPVASGRRLVGGNVQAVLLPCGAYCTAFDSDTLIATIYAHLRLA